MASNSTKQHTAAPINTLEQIAALKGEVRKEIDGSEERLRGIWDEMFRKPTAAELTSPTQRVLSWVTASAGMIDGALLGWKLYKRLSAGRRLFGRGRKS